jgi:hypothetical protein
MVKKMIGDACAHMVLMGGKSKYVRIGSAFQDLETQSISFKIDTLPVATSSGPQWSGWVNVFPREDASDAQSKRGIPAKRPPSYDLGDDIPF